MGEQEKKKCTDFFCLRKNTYANTICNNEGYWEKGVEREKKERKRGVV